MPHKHLIAVRENLMNMRKYLKIYFFIGIALSSEVLYAEEPIDFISCNTSVYGKNISLKYDINANSKGPNPWLFDHYTFREIFFLVGVN